MTGEGDQIGSVSVRLKEDDEDEDEDDVDVLLEDVLDVIVGVRRGRGASFREPLNGGVTDDDRDTEV